MSLEIGDYITGDDKSVYKILSISPRGDEDLLKLSKIWTYNDGGRKKAGFNGKANDCCVRSIAIATGMPYQEVYELVNSYGVKERMTKNRKKHGKSSARTGVYTTTARKILKALGWTWTPTMFIGSGCKVHLKASELPHGRIICSVSRHFCAVVDGVVQDTHNPTRKGKRCVYGYWAKE